MLSAEQYRSAVEEFDRLWAADRTGEFRARMDALLAAIENHERVRDASGERAGDFQGARHPLSAGDRKT